MQPIGHVESETEDLLEIAKRNRMKSPGKMTNDKIMDKRLEEDFSALKAKSQEKITTLTKEDIFDMLK